MANELSVTMGWATDKTSRIRNVPVLTTRYDLSSALVTEGVQSIGFAAHEAIVLGDVTTVGFAYFHNMDATNYVEIGIDVAASFHATIRLYPGQKCSTFLAAAPYAQAAVAAVLLDYVILERNV